MPSLMGHQSTLMSLSLLIMLQSCRGNLCFPRQVAECRAQDMGFHTVCTHLGELQGVSRVHNNQLLWASPPHLHVLHLGTSKNMEQPSHHPSSSMSISEAERLFNTPVSPCVPSQESQLGLEADRCLPPAGILLPSGRWQALGTMLPGLIPEYFSAHRKFFVTFPLL